MTIEKIMSKFSLNRVQATYVHFASKHDMTGKDERQFLGAVGKLSKAEIDGVCGEAVKSIAGDQIARMDAKAKRLGPDSVFAKSVAMGDKLAHSLWGGDK
jgi:hypothetical protein